jgi:hypothetical protein
LIEEFMIELLDTDISPEYPVEILKGIPRQNPARTVRPGIKVLFVPSTAAIPLSGERRHPTCKVRLPVSRFVLRALTISQAWRVFPTHRRAGCPPVQAGSLHSPCSAHAFLQFPKSPRVGASAFSVSLCCPGPCKSGQSR